MKMGIKAKAATASFVLVIVSIIGTATNLFIVTAEVMAFSMLLSSGVIIVLAALMNDTEVFTGWLTGIILSFGLLALLVGIVSIIEMLIKR